jgi:hypothetical protein
VGYQYMTTQDDGNLVIDEISAPIWARKRGVEAPGRQSCLVCAAPEAGEVPPGPAAHGVL